MHFEAAGCVFRGAGLATPACALEQLPLGVQHRFDRARDMIYRAGGTDGRQKARAMVKRAVQLLDDATRMVGRAQRRQFIGADCAGGLRSVLSDAKRRAQRWAHEIVAGS